MLLIFYRGEPQRKYDHLKASRCESGVVHIFLSQSPETIWRPRSLSRLHNTFHMWLSLCFKGDSNIWNGYDVTSVDGNEPDLALGARQGHLSILLKLISVWSIMKRASWHFLWVYWASKYFSCPHASPASQRYEHVCQDVPRFDLTGVILLFTVWKGSCGHICTFY